MEITDEQIIPASQAEVWRSLNDTEVLKDCIFGCESIDKINETEYAIVAGVAIGPVKAKFRGTLRLADLDPPNSYSMSFDTQGGTAGFGKGSAKVSLTPEGTGTRLRYTVNAQVGGKLAQLGARLIDGVAKKMANDFFTAFNKKVAGTAPAAAEPAVTAAPGAARWWWVAALIASALLLAYLWKR